jgi:hypothetical protein
MHLEVLQIVAEAAEVPGESAEYRRAVEMLAWPAPSAISAVSASIS